MKPHRNILGLALLCALASPAAQAEIVIDVIGGSEVSFEGMVQADGNWFSNDFADLNPGENGNGSNSEFELRRAELILKGKGPGNFEWVLGYDAKADKFLDTNIKYKVRGNSNHSIQAGQFKQPNSMEELSSTKNNDFIAKSAITNTFAIGRRLGVGYNYGDSDWGVTVSAFGRELTRNLAHGSGYGMRGYWAPINEKGEVLHLGLSYARLDTDSDTIRFRARPDADLALIRLVDTGVMSDVDRQATTGVEGLWIHGPFKVQGEYMRTTATRYNTANSDFTGTGGYVSGVWNITGETWGYKGGTPTTGLPGNPAKGMWQLGLRYDNIDLNDGAVIAPVPPATVPTVQGVLGGEMDTLTLGVNYYWRSNFKIALNYVNVSSSRYIKTTGSNTSEDPANNNATFNRVVDDNPHILEARLQFFW